MHDKVRGLCRGHKSWKSATWFVSRIFMICVRDFVAFCHSAEVGRTALSTEQFRSSALFCGGPVDLEFAARQSSWPRTESRYFQTSAEDIHFYKILMTKYIKRIRDLFEYALYKFTLYLLTYLLTCFLTYCFSLAANKLHICITTPAVFARWQH